MGCVMSAKIETKAEIEITPAMIEAGAEALGDCSLNEDGLEVAAYAVCVAMLRAMGFAVACRPAKSSSMPERNSGL